MLRRRTLNNFIIANFDVSDYTKSVQIIGWNQDNTTVTYDLSQILYIKVDGKITDENPKNLNKGTKKDKEEEEFNW